VRDSCWGSIFTARPHVVHLKGDLARPRFVWGVEFETRHWTAKSNGFQCIFRPTKWV